MPTKSFDNPQLFTSIPVQLSGNENSLKLYVVRGLNQRRLV